MNLTQEDTETVPPKRPHWITHNTTYAEAINRTFLGGGHASEFFAAYQAMWACRGACYRTINGEHSR